MLPVQLTSLVGNEAGFGQNYFERNENWSNSFQYSLLLCCFVEFDSFVMISERATLVEAIKWPTPQKKFVKSNHFSFGCVPR